MNSWGINWGHRAAELVRARARSALLAVGFVSLLGVAAIAQTFNFSPVAGRRDAAGANDGAMADARFDNPTGLALAPNGTLYVGDSGNYTVRSISPDGVVTTLAGAAGVQARVDGVGSEARFGSIKCITVDRLGQIYVADRLSNEAGFALRRISPDGTVQTLVRPEQFGLQAETGSATNWAAASALTTDERGNVYVADSGYYVIRKVTPAGAVSIFAGKVVIDQAPALVGPGLGLSFGGTLINTNPKRPQPGYADGPPGAARFQSLAALAVDANGYLYAADHNRIRKVSPSGDVSTVFVRTDYNLLFGPFFSGVTVASDGTLIVKSEVYLAGSLVETISREGATRIVQMGFSLEGLTAGPEGSLFAVAPAANLVLRGGYPPIIDRGPQDETVQLGDAARFEVSVTPGYGVRYQWRKDDVDIPGATQRVLELPAVARDAAGLYRVLASLPNGAILSAPAKLGIIAPPFTLQKDPSVIVAQPGQPVNVAPSFTLWDRVDLALQWRFNGRDLPGATAINLRIDDVTPEKVGFYTLVVSAGDYVQESAPITLVRSASGVSRLRNVSAMGRVDAVAGLSLGFSVLASQARSTLVRAVGPSLRAFGVTGVLSRPLLHVTEQGQDKAVVLSEPWNRSTTPEVLARAFAAVGAFPLSDGAADAVALGNLDSGDYSAQVLADPIAENGENGVVLAEVYDADPTAASGRLMKFSASGFVDESAGSLSVGFVIEGSAVKTVLVRVVGPGLAAPGLTGTLVNPKLTIVPIAAPGVAFENDDWIASEEMSGAIKKTGASALPAGSRDAALIVHLPSGAYTVRASDSAHAQGVARIEIYDLN